MNLGWKNEKASQFVKCWKVLIFYASGNASGNGCFIIIWLIRILIQSLNEFCLFNNNLKNYPRRCFIISAILKVSSMTDDAIQLFLLQCNRWESIVIFCTNFLGSDVASLQFLFYFERTFPPLNILWQSQFNEELSEEVAHAMHFLHLVTRWL